MEDESYSPSQSENTPTNDEPQADSPQPLPTALVPSISSAANIDILSLDQEHAHKIARNIMVGVVSVIVIGVILLIALFAVISQAYNTKASSSKSSGSSSSNSQDNEFSNDHSSMPNSSSNPTTGSASVGAEGAYCSNPVNAALSC